MVLKRKLKECNVCQNHRICNRDTKLGTLNNTSKPREVLVIDDVRPMDGKYMLFKVDFLFAYGLVECVQYCRFSQHTARY